MRKAQVSLQDLAHRVDLPRSTVHAYVTGKTLAPAEVLDKIVIALGADAFEQRRWANAWHRVYDRMDRQRRAIRNGKKVGTSELPQSDRLSLRAVPVPRQLPPDVAGFTCRGGELSALDELLRTARAEDRVPIGVVSGPAGVGKTALAVHWAHQVADRFPDGQLYMNLQGFSPSRSTVAPDEAVRGFLDSLGVARETLPPEPAGQVMLYRSMMADRRMLVLLDDVGDVEQVRPLLPGAAGSLVIVTSRRLLTGLIAVEGACPFVLEVLSAEGAGELLARRLGKARLAAEPAAVADIIAACVRLPLALAIVSARAVTHPHFPLRAIAAGLRDSRARLDALAGDDPAGDLRAVFSCSYNALSPEAAHLFRAIGLHPGPDVSVPSAASLVGASAARVRPMLGELAQTNLISEHLPGRYILHDLLRVYAAELAATVDPAPSRHVATHRMLDHYLHTASAADRLLDPSHEPTTLTSPQPETTIETLASRAEATAWFTAEHTVLLAAVDHAAATGFDTHTWQLACTLLIYLDWRGYWHDQTAVQRVGLAAAQRLADVPAQARSQLNLGRAATQLCRFTDARGHFQQALHLYRQVEDCDGQARSHLTLGILATRQHHYQEAVEQSLRALKLFREQDHQSLALEAHAVNNLGWDYAVLGDHRQALGYSEQALSMYEELDDRHGQASAWDSIGYLRHHLGDGLKALSCYRRALELFRELGDRFEESLVLRNLADTHHAMGDTEAAHAAYEEALAILDDLGHPDTEHLRARLSG